MANRGVLEREVVSQELFHCYFGIDYVPVSKNSQTFDKTRVQKYSYDFGKLENLPHALETLDFAKELILESYKIENRKDGQVYFENGRKYIWNAEQKEGRRIPTEEELRIRKIFFPSEENRSDSSALKSIYRNPATCKFKKAHSPGRDSCTHSGSCMHKKSLPFGDLQGRGFFCAPNGS